MIEQRIKVVSEALARSIDRRSFIRRASAGVASGITAFAMGSLLSTSPARAAVRSNGLVPSQPQCAPPGPYCNTGTGALSGCHGGHCYQHLYNGQVYACTVYYQYYPAGCWSTASGGGYWTCCDCSCGVPRVATCGCAQFSQTPAPLAE